MQSEAEIREKLRWCQASQEMTKRSMRSAVTKEDDTPLILRLTAQLAAEKAIEGILEWVLT